jgi:2-polyprenyl-6-methoxyphenol hydroxylase-like FAD-dependent oxidoreductase
LVLQQLGLFEQVIARAERIEGLHAWTHRRRTLVHLSYHRLRGDHCGYGVHRDDLFQVLYQHARAASVNFQLGVTIESSAQTATEILAIDSAKTHHGPFDVLIAADGARSLLRRAPELGATVHEFPLGTAWFSGRGDSVRNKLHQVTRGGRQLIGLLPLGQGRCSLFCALPRGGKEELARRGLDHVKNEITTLCPQAQSLVSQIDTLSDLTCTRYALVSLKKWSTGRLICIGDAAHSTTPHLGQGVNLALLDALAVADELNSATDAIEALTCAAQFRRRQVTWCWRLSNLLGPVFQNESRLLATARDMVLPWLPRLPWIGWSMVGTMAGLHTGLFSRLSISSKTPPTLRR